MSNIEKLIRNFANRLGFDITRYRDESSEYAKLVRMMAHNQISLVIDIGANRGQYAQLLRRYGYNGRIISFEPLQDAWNDLKQASQFDLTWEVYPRCAIGDTNTTSKINVSNNSVSSSLLAMLSQHSTAAPDSTYVRVEEVDIVTLDRALSELFIAKNTRIFIKIDTQGYELKVLNGARQSLSNATGIQIELSMVPLYEDQELFRTILEYLTTSGFMIWSFFPGFTDNKNGRMLQCDAILFRMYSENDNG